MTTPARPLRPTPAASAAAAATPTGHLLPPLRRPRRRPGRGQPVGLAGAAGHQGHGPHPVRPVHAARSRAPTSRPPTSSLARRRLDLLLPPQRAVERAHRRACGPCRWPAAGTGCGPACRSSCSRRRARPPGPLRRRPGGGRRPARSSPARPSGSASTGSWPPPATSPTRWQQSGIWFVTGSGDDPETHYPARHVRRHLPRRRGSPGLLLLHSPGNTFIRDLAPGETICIQPSALLYKDPSVGMQLHLEYPNQAG